MVNEVNFDALSRRVNESGGAMNDLNDLFGATFALEEWLFIARGELPNINPYVAANADYADGQQMIRAFTDANRLQRFAQESDLTDANGTAQMLTVPTGGIVEYLEQFVNYSVHGVWFNSDTKSEGYFIPLKQLRPIKEHLAKIGWRSINEPTNPDLPHNSGFVPPANQQQSKAPKTSPETVAVIVNDGLLLPSGFYKASTYACNFYCLVPSAWTEGDKLKEFYLERIYEKFYGVTWRTGNSDGSRYHVDYAFTTVLKPEEVRDVNWTVLQNDEKNHYWFFVSDENGEIRSVKSPEFQQAFDESGKTPAVPTQPPPPSNLENYGFSQTPDGDTDLRIKVFKTGNVKFGVSLVPFYAAVTLLLRNYQGSGEFEKIFNFAPEAMVNITENFSSNDHGKYFRIRKFHYQPPNAVADVTTIDSNQLHHIQTGATLKISFVLLQTPADSSASLYFGFEGGKSEVEKLQKAIAPALEKVGFVAEKTGDNSPSAAPEPKTAHVSAASHTSDFFADGYLNWFRRGTIKFESSFKPFFRAIAPLLENYAGAGEYKFTFATGMDESGMQDLFEDITSNSHGAYLKYRSYIFAPYEMQAIGSNLLTDTRTGDRLRVQLTMHRKLEEQTATLIVLFLGAAAEVERLDRAVQSALAECEFKVQLQLKKPPSGESLKAIGG